MAPKASTSRVKTDDDDSDDIDHSSPEATPAPSEGTNGPRVIPCVPSFFSSSSHWL